MKRIFVGKLKNVAYGSVVAMLAASILGLGDSPAYSQTAKTASGPPYALINLKGLKQKTHRYLCIGIDSSNGRAQQQTCTYKGSQAWGYGTVVHGLWPQFKNESSHANQRCLDVQGESTKVNAPIIGYTCESYSKRPDQYWRPVDVQNFKDPKNGKEMACWLFASQKAPSLAVATSGGSLNSGAGLIDGKVTAIGNSGSDIWCALPLG